MNKILLIIQREYLTRVRKKSFLIMTILGPILIVALYAVPIILATQTSSDKKEIRVVDETGLFFNKLAGSESVTYTYGDDLANAEEGLREKHFSAILHIPQSDGAVPSYTRLLYAEDQPSMFVQTEINNQLQNILRNQILLQVHNISPEDYKLINSAKIRVQAQNIETGKDSFIEIKSGLGIAMGILIYMFIFLFGSMVMSGVMEEKTNRIVEIMVSSIRPFQLMMGKIIGVAMVGLTQFLLWIVLSATIIGIGWVAFPQIAEQAQQLKEAPTTLSVSRVPTTQEMEQIQQAAPGIPENIQGLLSIDFSIIICSFLFYFLFGYLFYAALFAAIGSVVETQSDSQQFMLPITIPLVLSFLVFPSIIRDPNGSVAFWFSMIPFTSPVSMLVRIPFGVPYWQMALSAGLLVLGFFGSTWLAGKIYRVGILMYGKKVTYPEIWKWLKYRN